MNAAAFPRRAFLKGSALGTAALATASATGLAGCTPGETPPEGLRFLRPSEFHILKCAADRFVPRGGPYPEGAVDVGVAKGLDGFLATDAPAVVASNFRTALWALELGAPVLGGGFRRFTSMSPEQRDAYLIGLLHTRHSVGPRLYAGLKRACLFAFYETETAWRHIGYDGPWVGRPSTPGTEAEAKAVPEAKAVLEEATR